MARVYLGLGSNLGDRASNLWEATRQMSALSGLRSLRLSPLYETEPVGPVDQPSFLNAAVAAITTIRPLDLLYACQTIEQRMGRTLGERWGPRLIDIDLLLYGNVRLQSDRLALPHPEVWKRRFVLVPLLDVAVGTRLRWQVAYQLANLAKSPTVVPYRPTSTAQGGRTEV